MKKYIKTTYIAYFLLIVMVVICATFYMFYNAKKAHIKENLEMISQAIKIREIPEDVNLSAYSQALAKTNENLRVTIIDGEGTVRGDSEVDITTMDNHRSRVEVDMAIRNGFGETIRTSDTTGIKTIYSATKIDDNTIIRLSYPLVVTYDFLSTMMPVLFFLTMIMLKFINSFANSFSQKLLLPLENINKLLETKQQIKVDKGSKIKSFEEVEPILNNIDYLIRKLNYDFTEMEKTQQMRTDFVANVSHELKSPLTSIKGFAELISSGLVPSKEKQDDYLRRIVDESDRLLHIINDILRLSEAESVPLDSKPLELVSLDKVANNVMKSLESLGAEKNTMLIVTGKGSIQAVEKDVWELIYNLVDNGIRYGVKNGFVQVKIETIQENIVLTVQDNGIGIEKEHLPRIFERFYRVDTSRSRKSGGTGLGLSIVRNIAVKYGGTVAVDSNKGDGAVFKIKFPSK